MKKRQSNAEIQAKIHAIKLKLQAINSKKSISQAEYDETKRLAKQILELEKQLVEEY